jgi:hypothetical protein
MLTETFHALTTRLRTWLKARLGAKPAPYAHQLADAITEALEPAPAVQADLAAMQPEHTGDTVPAPDVVSIGIETVKEALGENGVDRHVFTVEVPTPPRDREAVCLAPVAGSYQWMLSHEFQKTDLDPSVLWCTRCGRAFPE